MTGNSSVQRPGPLLRTVARQRNIHNFFHCLRCQFPYSFAGERVQRLGTDSLLLPNSERNKR